MFHITIQEEFAEMSFNSYLRSVEEYIAPFREHTSTVYRAGFRLVAIEIQITPCPVYTEWLKQENKGINNQQLLGARKNFFVETESSIKVWWTQCIITMLQD